MKIIIEKNGQSMKVQVYYTAGGYNNFLSKEEERGYYVAITPVTITEENGISTVTHQSQHIVKELLLPVATHSNEKEAEAIALVTEEKINALLYPIA